VRKRGFTLIEILIVVGIIAMLAAIVIIAINPGRQFAQTRNTQRWANINSILNAVHQNMIDNKGTFTCAAGDIPTTSGAMTNEVGGYDICNCIVDIYIAEMPYDPVNGSYTDCANYNTGYNIFQNTTNHRITVEAPQAELGATIKVTR